jgi:hypothetical protein
VAGGEVRRGGAPIWWKKWSDGKGAARAAWWRSIGGGQDGVVKMGKK